MKYREIDGTVPTIDVSFEDCKGAVALASDRIMEAALQALKSRHTDVYYARKAWSAVRCFLVASINTEDDKKVLQFMFNHSGFTSPDITMTSVRSIYKCNNAQARKVQRNALAAMFGQ